MTLVFDRHPVAACLCYPFARYCLREINAEDLLMLAAAMPPEAPGANLVVCTLPRPSNSAAWRRGPGPETARTRAFWSLCAMLTRSW